MYLWNDYEGRMLAGIFPLERLLRTEGRSAAFATRHANGRPAVIRLTEALNDQEQMRERYSLVQSVRHPHLVAIEEFGDTTFEGDPLIYVVTELTEESLGDILVERRLSLEETHEVARSLVSAIETLHETGLVHGLVEPANVLAAGEVIKLRSDCIRLAPGGVEGARARAEDVWGVADVLNRALTQNRLQDASDALALPEPYASIVRQVARGSWGIEQVAGELRRSVRGAAFAGPPPVAPAVAASAVSSAAPAAAATAIPAPARAAAPVITTSSVPAPAVMAPSAASAAASGAAAAPATGGVRAPLADEDPSFAEALAAANRVFDRAAAASVLHPAPQGEPAAEQKAAPRAPGVAADLPDDPAGRKSASSGLQPPLPLHNEPSRLTGRRESAELSRGGLGSRWLPGGAIAAAVLVAGLVSLQWARGRHTPPPASTGIAATPAAPVSTPKPSAGVIAPPARSQAPPPARAAAPILAGSEAAPPPARSAAPAPSASEAAAPPANASGTPGKIWRVVAYTYNREDQAQAKAHAVSERHASLHPEVFSRAGGAPFLVTLGGPLSHDAAAALLRQARSQGLPHDLYIQNYSH